MNFQAAEDKVVAEAMKKIKGREIAEEQAKKSQGPEEKKNNEIEENINDPTADNKEINKTELPVKFYNKI